MVLEIVEPGIVHADALEKMFYFFAVIKADWRQQVMFFN